MLQKIEVRVNQLCPELGSVLFSRNRHLEFCARGHPVVVSRERQRAHPRLTVDYPKGAWLPDRQGQEPLAEVRVFEHQMLKPRVDALGERVQRDASSIS